jgi:D-glycero-D-manno-heptose 1,7-bisphosphate phosphatase
MALEAKIDFPEIDFSKSIMVGDTDSDILFGENLGMKTARIVTKEPIGVVADMNFISLQEMAIELTK